MQTATLPTRIKGKPKGFTLVEILVATGIFIGLLGLILANYRRGNDDSILSRETILFMSRLRLAQEQTAAGTVAGYCKVGNPDATCASENDCTTMGSTTCTVNTPSGGFGIVASCSAGSPAFGNNHWPDQSHYFMFGDRVQCQRNCFPFVWADGLNWPNPPDTAFVNVDQGTDHLYSSDDWGSLYKGDTIAATYTLDPKVTILDMQLLENGTTGKVTCANNSPWENTAEPAPQPLTPVPNDYPLQAVVHFPTPDGRTIILSDNVSTTTPTVPSLNLSGGKAWKEVHFMLALQQRTTNDCQVVRVTKDGIITKLNDDDCQF